MLVNKFPASHLPYRVRYMLLYPSTMAYRIMHFIVDRNGMWLQANAIMLK